MSIIHLLASRNFIVVNKDVARKIGLDEAIMLGELASEYGYWETRSELTEDGFFFTTVENVEANTTFSQYKQQRTIERLQELGLLYVDRRGLPAKRYIKLREKNILKLFDNDEYDDTFVEKKVIRIKEDYTAEFAEVWKKYPKKQGKTQAEKAYIKARKEGVTREQIEAGLDKYIRSIEQNKTEDRYIKHGSTWFNQRCWNDEYKQVADNSGVQSHGWNYDELQKLAEKSLYNL